MSSTTTPSTTPAPSTQDAAPTPAAYDPTPFEVTMSWSDSCRPNLDSFTEAVTPEQLAFMAAEGLSFTDADDDYDIRHILVDKLEAFDPDDYPDSLDLPGLIDTVNEALCPLECGDCAQFEREYISEVFDDAVAAFEKAHPDVIWLVTEDDHEAVTVEETPTLLSIEEHYHRRSRGGWDDLTVAVHTEDAFAEVSFGGRRYHVFAVVEKVAVELMKVAIENAAGYAERLEVAKFISAPAELRALMLHLYENHGEVDMPDALAITRTWRPTAGVEKMYGSLGEASLDEMHAVAAPLLGLTSTEIAYAMLTLPTTQPNWSATVAAVRAAAA